MAGRWPGGYVFQPFPKCLYHRDGRTVVVQNAGEELALGPDWSEKPYPPEADTGPALETALCLPVPEPRRRGRPRKTG